MQKLNSVPSYLFKNKENDDFVHKFLNPYNNITWEELLQTIPEETEVIEYLKLFDFHIEGDPIELKEGEFIWY